MNDSSMLWVKVGVGLLLLVVLCGVLFPSFILSNPYNVLGLRKVCAFLKGQYVPDVGLLRASFMPSNRDYDKVYLSDNLLGYMALRVCGFNKLAESVHKTLLTGYGNYLYTSRWEVLSRVKIGDNPRVRFDKVLGRRDDVTIVAELQGNKVLSDWRDYADWLFLESLNSLIERNITRALELFREGMAFFDGYGFADKAYSKTRVYDTYKLGLAVFTYRALSEPSEYEEKIRDMLHILSEAQDPESGGIFTNYKVVKGKLMFSRDVSDVNVETSSVVVLALYSNLPESLTQTMRTNRFPLSYYLLILLALTMAALIVFMLLKSTVFKKALSSLS